VEREISVLVIETLKTQWITILQWTKIFTNSKEELIVKLSKKLALVLATIITSSVVLLSIPATAYAKASALVVLAKDGTYYEYNYADLKASAVSALLGDTVNGALYQSFVQNDSSLEAFYDDTRNVYVPATAVDSQATSAILSNQTFNLDSYLENSSTPSITITTTKLQNNSGVVSPVTTSTTSSGFDVVSIQ
jgi:hypothetical protein